MVALPTEPNHISVEPITLDLDESKPLPSTEEMLDLLQETSSRCLSWL